MNEDLLLTIGIGPAGDDGFGLDWSQTQISLFDVSDLENPSLADSLSLSPGYLDDNCADIRSCGWSWSWSEATYEHKAFNYWAPENLLAVPLSTHRWVYDTVVENDRTYTYYGYEFVSMLKLVNVDIENKSLTAHGKVIILLYMEMVSKSIGILIQIFEDLSLWVIIFIQFLQQE